MWIVKEQHATKTYKNYCYELLWIFNHGLSKKRLIVNGIFPRHIKDFVKLIFQKYVLQFYS